MRMKEDYPIDVVILWVDGSDEEWQKEKAHYKGESASCDSVVRFRDWDNLQYVFRGIERFWPWVNKVFLVTNGQRPKWLNEDCERLRLVTHKEFMPAEHLPTFNSNAIELNLHRIADLSEHFILMNDDMFPIRPLPRTEFFRDGLPCDYALMAQLYSIKSEAGFNIEVMDFCNLGLLNAHFRKRRICCWRNRKLWYGSYLGLSGILRNLSKWHQCFFTGFDNIHSVQSFLKTTFEEVWAAEPDYLWKTSGSRVRHDTNVTQYLMRYWQLAKNEFAPNRFVNRRCFSIDDKEIDDIVDCVGNQTADIVCLNDTEDAVMTDVALLKERINGTLEHILPEKSSFEKDEEY